MRLSSLEKELSSMPHTEMHIQEGRIMVRIIYSIPSFLVYNFMLIYFYQTFFCTLFLYKAFYTSFSPFSLPLYYLFFFPRLLQILPFFFFSFLSPLPLSFTLFSYPLQLSSPPLQFTSLFHFLQFSPLFILSLHYSSFFLLLFSSPLLCVPLL